MQSPINASSSDSFLRIDPIRCGQRFSALDPHDIVERVNNDPFHGIHGSAAVVGHRHDVVHPEQRVVPTDVSSPNETTVFCHNS